MLQLLQFVFLSLQFCHREIPAFNSIDDCLHLVLAEIIRLINIIEEIIMLVFHKVVGETFEDFEQDCYGFNIVALA